VLTATSEANQQKRRELSANLRISDGVDARLSPAGGSSLIGRFDSDEKHVPVDVLAGGCRTPSRKGLIQRRKVRDFIRFHQYPVGDGATAGTIDLPAEYLD
jgi:hypothetical protein